MGVGNLMTENKNLKIIKGFQGVRGPKGETVSKGKGSQRVTGCIRETKFPLWTNGVSPLPYRSSESKLQISDLLYWAFNIR